MFVTFFSLRFYIYDLVCYQDKKEEKSYNKL